MRRDEAAALDAAARSKAGGTGRDAALDSALDAALSVASADCANIQRIHPDRRGLMLIAQRG